jgi:predicted SAM-dependent methyltransferase
MRINYGCGRQVLDGWINVDAVRSPQAPRPPDVLFAMRFDASGALIERTPLPDECATDLQAMHVIEHFYAWEVPAVLAEWRRLLQRGGRLILELPNLEMAARNLLSCMGDKMSMWPLYGDPAHRDPYMCHRWGYTPRTLSQALLDAGFVKPQFLPPQTHGRKVNRDMRCEAIRP